MIAFFTGWREYLIQSAMFVEHYARSMGSKAWKRI
jgi:hypothetical protein